MSQKHFWGGVATGIGATVGTLWALGMIDRGGASRIVRLEKSVQIGRPVREVFEAWRHFERIPQYCRYITHVHSSGFRSHWTANVDGNVFNWEAELTQLIPDQVIGWKSVNGSKHSGRVTFSPIGNDTLVHVQMNYVPPSPLLRPLIGAMSGHVEGYIEQALRDFKTELEARNRDVPSSEQATGTYGTDSLNANPVYDSVPQNMVEFTRPTEPSPLKNRE
jgi:uncharacterized membrane protein